GLDHPGRVLVGVGVLHRLVLAVPQGADDIGQAGLAALERDQHLVAHFREPVEPAAVAGGGLADAGPVALGLSREAGKADLHPALFHRILDVGDQRDLDAVDGGVAGLGHRPGLLQECEDVVGAQGTGPPRPRPIRCLFETFVKGSADYWPARAFFSLTSVSTTVGSASVETSPRVSNSSAAIFLKILRMILPDRVLGSEGAQWITSG